MFTGRLKCLMPPKLPLRKLLDGYGYEYAACRLLYDSFVMMRRLKMGFNPFSLNPPWQREASNLGPEVSLLLTISLNHSRGLKDSAMFNKIGIFENFDFVDNGRV